MHRKQGGGRQAWAQVLTLVFLLCAACSFNGSVRSGEGDGGGERSTDAAPSDASLPEGTYRKSIVLTPAGLSDDLNDFVVAILVETDSDLVARAQSDGTDIKFLSALGEPLDYEIEEYESASGRLAAWVKLPTLSSAGPTTIYLYYGDSVVVHDPEQTWSGGFASVWHYAEDPRVSDPIFANSASASLDASSSGQNRPMRGVGIAGPSLDFDGIDDRLVVLGSENSALDFASESFSFSAWVYVESSVGSFDMIWWKGGSSSGQRGYDVELGTGGWVAYVSDGGGNNTPNVDITGVGFGSEAEFLSRWVHLAVVVDREANELRAYADGEVRDVKGISNIGSLSTGVLGRMSTGNYPYHGLLDEMRIYDMALSDDWVRTEFANLSSPATFFKLGPQEGTPR